MIWNNYFNSYINTRNHIWQH